MAAWSVEEFGDAKLGDVRLNKRLIKLADRFADQPTESIPGACGDWAETQAAYRFFDQTDRAKRKLEWEDVLAPHFKATEARIRQHKWVLAIQDTTELNFNGQVIQGLGPLSHEVQRGMYLHPTLVVTPEREPLGVTDAWMWARELKDENGVRAGLCESQRWLEGYERVAEMAARLPDTRMIYVADREADMLDLMQLAQRLGLPADWLVRAKHNRCLPEGDKLWERLAISEVLGEIEFTLPARPGLSERQVRQQLFSCRIRLEDGQGGHFMVSGVMAKEVGAPKGVKPIEWKLLTSREINCLEEAVQLVDWYRARWEIEIFFHVLKNGCRVEALQLGNIKKLEVALAIYMVVAWRLGRLMRMGRVNPELEAALMFSTEEWKAAYVLNDRAIPDKMPTVQQVVRLVAQLGGFLARKSDGEPGVKTIWKGLEKIRYFVKGLEYAKSFSGLQSCV